MKTLAIFLAVMIPNVAADKIVIGTVVNVHGGDTLTLRTEVETLKMRLSGIDMPELAQSFGNNAKQDLSVVGFGKTVTSKSSGKSRYGRKRTYIFIDNQPIKTMTVRMGMAWCYCRYDMTKKLENTERYAKENKIGLWADRNPIASWNWRRGKR